MRVQERRRRRIRQGTWPSRRGQLYLRWMSSRYGWFCLVFWAAACDASGGVSERDANALGSTPTPSAPRPDASAASRTDAGTPPLSDAGTPPLSDAGPLPIGDAETVTRDGGSEVDARAAACTWEYDERPVDGGVSPIYYPSSFSSPPDIPVDSGADGQLCLTLCSTPRCFPFAEEFDNDGDGQDCLDDCVASYQHARAWAPEACLDAMAHRDDVYLSAPCDCNSEQVVVELSAELDSACTLSPSSAESSELGMTCRAHCSQTATDGEDNGERCFEQCVADFSRYWLLGGSRCLELELEFQDCVAQGGDSESCEGEAPFYACLQATR